MSRTVGVILILFVCGIFIGIWISSIIYREFISKLRKQKYDLEQKLDLVEKNSNILRKLIEDKNFIINELYDKLRKRK